MIKSSLLFSVMALTLFGFQNVTLAQSDESISQGTVWDYATTPQPGPRPYHPTYPAPQPYPAPYPAQMITCYAQGLANGAWFYGVAYNVYAANQYALGACQATGQYCRLTGCQ
jgi:hypothetical protein